MKKLKLRMWVKVVFALVIVGGMFAFVNNHTDKAIDQCVNAGHSQNYCEAGLR